MRFLSLFDCSAQGFSEIRRSFSLNQSPIVVQVNKGAGPPNTHKERTKRKSLWHTGLLEVWKARLQGLDRTPNEDVNLVYVWHLSKKFLE